MGFEFDKLFGGDSFKTEFLPHEKVKKGQGLKLDLNKDVISLDYLERARKNVADLLELDGTALNPLPANETENAEEKSEETIEDIKKNLGSQLQFFDSLTSDIKLMATVLGGRPGEDIPGVRVIKSWDLMRGGKPVPVSYEELSGWKFSILKRLYNFCVYEASEPEKKKEKPSVNT